MIKLAAILSVICAQWAFINSITFPNPISGILQGTIKSYSNEWPYAPPTYTGNWQSPVDINIDEATVMDIPTLTFHMNVFLSNQKVTVKNTGKAVEVILKANKPADIPYLTGGVLNKDTFLFEKMIVHWGSGVWGSENAVNRFRYGIEINLLFWNQKYQTYENARGKTDGLTIASYFGRVGPYDNRDLDLFFQYLPEIRNANAETQGIFGDALYFLQHSADGSYYATLGSTTIEPYVPCTWMIFKLPFEIGINQALLFHQLAGQDGNPLIDTSRQIQQLGGRPVVTPTVKKPVRLDISVYDTVKSIMSRVEPMQTMTPVTNVLAS